MEKRRIYLASPTMNGSERGYIEEAFATNWIAPLGPNVNEFEKELAAYVGITHAAALTSGTAAIHLALKAIGIRQGDIVFCSSLTFSATCNPIIYEGGIPVFIDSENDSWNMDPEALRKAFGKYPNAKAVLLVHLYGTPAKLKEIMDICKEYKVPLIEDAAESLGATYHGKQTGTFGSFGIYSFNGNKIITTSGGGMLVSKDGAAIEKARFWATQAREKEIHYEHKEIGYNYRMSNIVAGIGRGQLLSLDEFIEQKKSIYDTYKKAFEDIKDITMNPIPKQCEANYWLSCITLNKDSKVKPLDIMMALEEENIESRPIWKPMHLQPVFKEYDFIAKSEVFGTAEDIFNRGVCLPSDIKNTGEDMKKIIGIIRALFNC
ncbi:aminotransferase class I/II-fold pyridoxal phosphate-dependent enzyme [Mobilitalea sibirica]|uniref:Aminotransferase class I/II-fold pyridoxal phosphate-dependent enzyme n=1 Tax=Mobilitalea sibirica TaxID=1462919 RepID=A0A8J7HCG2_9FIRM|nr:aminotransferase class I/II-fold pyridoxal phosphate-dependent enzyme [Mobilitalea sibirica]MBH1942041.1 aminotransferase class I/II-fold pyridoxal phosphate-dependent enzyme [Mobilitalea sibirica]